MRQNAKHRAFHKVAMIDNIDESYPYLFHIKIKVFIRYYTTFVLIVILYYFCNLGLLAFVFN